MKQVNVLMEEELVAHLEKWALIESYHFPNCPNLSSGNKTTVSDVIRRAVKEYTSFGYIDLNVKIQADGNISVGCSMTEEQKEKINKRCEEISMGKTPSPVEITFEDRLKKINLEGAFGKALRGELKE